MVAPSHLSVGVVAGAGSSDEFYLTCAGEGAPFVKLAVSEGRGANAYPFETQALEVVAALPPLAYGALRRLPGVSAAAAALASLLAPASRLELHAAPAPARRPGSWCSGRLSLIHI